MAVPTDNSCEPLAIADLFPKSKVWKSPKDELFVERVEKGTTWSVSEMRSSFEKVVMHWVLGAMEAQIQLPGYHLAHAFEGFSYFWDANAIYKALKLVSYQNKPSAWVFAKKAKWKGQGITLFNSLCHVSASMQEREKSRVRRHVNELLLPTTSLSTPLLMALLAQWSICTHAKGGFIEFHARQAASEMLNSLTTASVAGSQCAIDIVDKPTWQPPFPGREEAETAATLVLDKQGHVKLEALLSYFRRSDQGHKELLLQRAVTKVLHGHQSQCSIANLLQALVLCDPLEFILKQLCYKIGYRVERVLQRTLTGEATGPLWASSVDIEDVMDNNDRLDQEILKHMAIASGHVKNFNNFTFATDDAHVGGPSLCNTVVVCKDNTAIPMIPQASATENL